jgi:bifunctional non-homologous end joining protein LigD
VALETYRKKRKFSVTSEPRGHKGKRGGDRYVIQKHAARRLHYDLRLELDGVMKSWAVTRGPSLDPNEKRLAVHVEDHPIEYNTFEGTIPPGEYGGGTVQIWDRGHWEPLFDPHKGLAKGHLEFELKGKKLHGRWHLVRLRSRNKNDRHDNWLLIKAKDEQARGPGDVDILNEAPLSVASGRSIEEIAAGKGKKRVWHSNKGAAAEPPAKSQAAKPAKPVAKPRGRAKAAAAPALRKSTVGPKVPLPDFVPPSLATLRDGAPGGKAWLHEIKFDGYRIEARLDHGKVRLLTRNRQDWTHRFKPIAVDVAALPAETALLDGELVVEDHKGVSNFSLLQTALKNGELDRLVYYVFDLLHLDGRDLTGEPLTARKAALALLLKPNGRHAQVEHGRIRYTEHFDEDGPVIFRHAAKMHLEGIVSKRRDAPYRSGRTENFIKAKCHDSQEFIVAGFTPSAAERNAVGALAAAFYESGKLHYAGRVGSGFTHETARELWRKLDKLRTERPTVTLPEDEKRKDLIFVKPQVVVEVEFRGITHGNLLRQAAYKGLREDKPAREVVREVAVAHAASAAQRQTVRKSAKSSKANAPAKTPAKSSKANAAAKTNNKVVVGNVQLTHPDRVYWADVGVTKRDLAEYYVGVWDWMAPHVIGRPLALLRCPDGTSGQCFFQKHIQATIKSSALRYQVGGKEQDVIAIETLDDLITLAQSGALEIHIRGSRLGRLEECDRIVFDLDPGDGVDWATIVAGAREIRDRLRALKLESFVKLSGGKGVHVVLPIARADWDTAKDFAQRITLALAADSPQRYVGKMTKSLRKGRIFIDYFRNSREATSVAPYSTRARVGAPVSVPLTWEQLGKTKASNEYSVLDLKQHFRKDAWADIGKVRQKLPAK